MTYALMYRNQQGKRLRYTIGKHGAITPVQARKIAAAKLAQVRLGSDPQTDKTQARWARATPTLREFSAGEYGEWVRAHRKSAQQTIDRILSTFVDIADTRLNEITAWNLEKWRSKRIKNGIEPATINRDLIALQGALTKACAWGKLETSPFAGIKPLAVDDTPTVRYLDKDEEGSAYGPYRQRRANKG